MIKSIYNPKPSEWNKLTQRPVKDNQELMSTIKDIYTYIEDNDDEGLLSMTFKYDKVELSSVGVDHNEIEEAISEVDKTLKKALNNAYQNISAFHQEQRSEKVEVKTQEGVNCWQKSVPIQKVGLYIPGGTAPLFSTVLMLAIPAKIAGCEELVLCTPPNKEGKVHPAILYAAKLCGVDHLFKVGGAQAIAAMAIGTTSVPKVDKIFGPGNQYVTAAKQFAFQKGIAIDMPAGPSEVLVFADESGNANFIAADLLSQAEHGIDSQVVMVSTDKQISERVEEELSNQLLTLPRKEIAAQALTNSMSLIFDNVIDAFGYINAYAPEHFIIASENPERYLDLVKNAGSVFVGNYSPESVGDYASGTNHTLPTAGAAKAFSGVNLDSFLKKITFQQLSRSGLKGLSQTVMVMARAEELEAHARAVEIRIKDLEDEVAR